MMANNKSSLGAACFVIFMLCGAVLADDNKEVYSDDPDYETVKKENYKNSATFLVFDKLDHSVREIETAVRSTSNYKTLELLLIACWSNDELNHKALIKVLEKVPIRGSDGHKADTDKVVFHGWVFSDSPSLSNMEHPKYYMRLLMCHNSIW